MTAELNAKLISRSILGFELAIELIFSRSSVDSERVGRIREGRYARSGFIESAAHQLGSNLLDCGAITPQHQSAEAWREADKMRGRYG
jgi:hypothetical protein